MTREHLLEAAAEVFARRGYQAATLEEVAKTAGFTTGAIYSNFSGKEDLFLALVSQQEERLIDAFGTASQPELDPAELVASLRAVYAGASNEERERNWQLWTEFTLHAMRNPDARKRLEAEQQASLGLVVDLVQRQSEETGIDLPLPAELVARIYIALFSGLWQQQAISPDEVDDDAFSKAVVFIAQALEALGTPRPTKRRRPSR